MKSRNDKSMFINYVTQNELCKVVNNFHSKASADVNGISMCMVKKVFHCIIHPFQQICNLSLRIGIFPDNMKIVGPSLANKIKSPSNKSHLIT